MQLKDAMCYFVLMITIVGSVAKSEDQKRDLSETKSVRRIMKRDAAIFIDSFPIEPIYKQRPQIIYRRISKQRYKSPKPKYGPPMYRTKSRKPVKKYKGNVKPIYGPPSYKRRPTKPRYGPPKRKFKPPAYGPPQKAPQSYYAHEPVGFGEPPIDEAPDYPTKQNFGEPPLDSYGSPINVDVINPYIPDQFSPSSYSDSPSFDSLKTNIDDETSPWENYQDQNYDNNMAYSKKEPTFLKPEHFDPDAVRYSKKRPTFTKLHSFDSEDFTYSKNRPIFVKANPYSTDDEPLKKKRPITKPDSFYSDDIVYKTKRPAFTKLDTYEAEDFDSIPYSHIYRHDNNDDDDDEPKKKRRPYYTEETIKTKSRRRQPTIEPDDDVLVGGRYAEPPARFVPKYQQTLSLQSEDSDFTPLKGFVDPDIAISATISPYVNYKHSNVAFSPQNLNDAFSIVDKK